MERKGKGKKEKKRKGEKKLRRKEEEVRKDKPVGVFSNMLRSFYLREEVRLYKPCN